MNTVEPAPIMAIFVMCRPVALLVSCMLSYASTSSAARTSRFV